jgi:putative ABC transport system ATP-binding protein
LFDEPTAALDESSGQRFLEVLQELRDLGKIVVLVSHDSRLISFADRVYTVSDGTITPEFVGTRYIQGEKFKALQLPDGPGH